MTHETLTAALEQQYDDRKLEANVEMSWLAYATSPAVQRGIWGAPMTNTTHLLADVTTTYTVHGYNAKDELAHTVEHVDALDALRAAYAWVGPLRVAHILQDGTTSGIYIARSGDLERATLGDCLQSLTRPGRFS